jgi:UDP-3-O-[3-hydroxymyristoyl] N-acetylglucosamine deacetylase
MAYRRTLKRDVGCTGIGLHTGRLTRLRLCPAAAEHGVRFRRVDVGVEIPATIENLAHLDHATTLQHQGVTVSTVEHLLSALRALGVDDVLVEIDGPEIPILDGSASPFVILIHEAGLKPLPIARQYLKVTEPVEIVRGGKSVRLSPADQLRISYTIGFDHPLLRHQAIECRVSGEAFAEEIAPARTFGFLRDVELLRRAGLALGGSLDNAIVIGETGVLNNKLRFEDEFVRHKVLDAIGDLALLGHPVVGHLEAVRAGHALHTALAQKLLATPQAWTLVAHPELPVVGAILPVPSPLVPQKI